MAEIGARLREARLRLKVDINEVETRTKIRAKYLRAMEDEEWDLLPGEVYVRSFLRTYGEYLGLDTRQLLDDFRRRYEAPSDHEPPPIVPATRDPRRRDGGRGRRAPVGRRRGGVAPWAITAVVLAAVIAALVIVGLNNGKSGSQTTASHSASSAGHHRRPHGSATRTRTRTAPPAPTVVHLSLVPTGPVYVCLVDGTGKQLIAGRIFNAGETIPVPRASKLLLTLGNNQVTMKADGQTIPVSASASAIGYEFTPGHHAPLPASRQPRCGG